MQIALMKGWLLPFVRAGTALYGGSVALAADGSAVADFRSQVQPILSEYCYDCHADGVNKGGVAFDELKTNDKLLDHDLWARVLRNLRAGLMPPEKKPHPSPEQLQVLANWIKYDAFEIDPNNPDPGKVTVRRLNRVEYKNTIHDLMGVDYDTEGEFPADDTGYGFDNIADVLTLSPMLLEKYLDAAKAIVSKAVPATGATPEESVIQGRSFRGGPGALTGGTSRGGFSMSYYSNSAVSNSFKAGHAGHYQINLDLTATEKFVDNQFDYNKCRMTFKVDGIEAARADFTREGTRAFHYHTERQWEVGEHVLSVAVEPLTLGQKQVRSLNLRIDQVTVRGPLEEKYWVRPKDHERFFGKPVPKSTGERRELARRLLKDFATKAYRRPPDSKTVDRLARLAEEIYRRPGSTFEAGVAQAMVAVLASPRFLFREEPIPSSRAGEKFGLLDEYSLASRLSYFLWSSMPDDELFGLAEKGQLRKNLPAQVKRMLANERSSAFVRNFTGQWLQARDVENIPIEARAVLAREEKQGGDYERKRARIRELRAKSDQGLSPAEKEEFNLLRKEVFRSGVDLTTEIRQSMRRETEMYFANLIREDRSLLELVDSDYTFLNEALAKHYGLSDLDIKGEEMRWAKLPNDSPRGGVLTMGTVLVVTSNPTRTSPVKRGLFVLDNILGMPPPPPPPNIPPLEDAAKKINGREPTLRETLEMHRSKPLCNSCHNRMDPLGLAMENFNALGMWRDQERGQPVETTGRLLTGESFSNIRELKKILAERHSRDVYQCLTEKLLTYATGRGLEYYDVKSIDDIVEKLQKENGRFSVVLNGVIESAPFQKARTSAMVYEDDQPRKGSKNAKLNVHSQQAAR